MAASKKLDSCSPIPGRPTNPHSRNSETSDLMRRSFSGSPFVKPTIISNQRGGGLNPNFPANSPSDYPRRNSISRENVVITLIDHEDKENGKDQNWKSVRIRSPAQGTKNFMSPTISAASKINASPRKKILADTNEQIRTSISSADAKGPLMEDLDSKPDKVPNQKKEVSFDSIVTYLGDNEDSKSTEHVDLMVDWSSKDDLDMSSENLTMEKDCVNLDPSFKISPRVSSSFPAPALSRLDADSSMPTYDPKTNYLSPRPQFLHYRPNPRIELYLNKERDGQPLEEIFTSESSSETEVSEAEDSHSDESGKESDAYAADEVKEEEKLEELLLVSEPISIITSVEEEELLVSEPISISTSVEEEELLVSEPNSISTSVEEEELLLSEPNSISTSLEEAEEKRVSTSHFYARRKFTALLLVLTVGFLYVSVSKSPVMDPSVLNNFTFSEPYVPSKLSEYHRQTFEGLSQKVQLWRHQSLYYMHNMINSFRYARHLGPFQYANLTVLFEDGIVDGQFAFDQSILGSKVKHEEKVLESVKAAEVNINLADEEDQPGAADENIEVAGNNNDWDFDGVPDSEEFGDPESKEETLLPRSEVTEPGESAQEIIQESFETAAIVVELRSNMVLEDQPLLIPQATEIQPEILNFMPSQGINDTGYADIVSPAAKNNFEILAGGETENLRSLELVNVRSAQIIMGISLIVFSLLGTAFIYMKSQTPATRNDTFTVDQMPVAAEHTDVVGESCSAEMSSFSLSYSKKGQKGTIEAQSCERKTRKNNYRRESLAASDYSIGSMGSLSYGSFTTYEKIPIKHGNEDEEVITPVRRSSRIRNQVTSPCPTNQKQFLIDVLSLL